jgi:hypothetical protein
MEMRITLRAFEFSWVPTSDHEERLRSFDWVEQQESASIESFGLLGN